MVATRKAIRATFDRFTKALPELTAIDPSRMTVTSVLTYPTVDLEGDLVAPDGCRGWADTPCVNHEHGIPIGHGVPTTRMAMIDGKEWELPIGLSHFAQRVSDLNGVDMAIVDGKGRRVGRYDPNESLQVAPQAFALVEHGILTGVSLEAHSLNSEVRGRSLIRGGPAYAIHEWEGDGWAHCRHPINPGAQVLAPELVEKAFQIAGTGRLNGEPLRPLIRKSLQPYLDQFTRRAMVPGVDLKTPVPVRKAMADYNDPAPDPEDTPDDVTADTGEPDETSTEPDAEAAPGLKKTGMAVMSLIQQLMDTAKQIKDAVAGPDLEDKEGLELLSGVADQIEELAKEAKVDAQKVWPDGGFGAPDNDTGEPDDTMPMTDDGAVMSKAFRKGFPTRFKVSDLRKPAATVSKGLELTPAELRELNAGLKRVDRKTRKIESRTK
ncbi:hypothetical protein [Fimbriiglobus ruber]|uniref:Uncharacterized protein n=1 Tax=Fimbriiglobus ruber TaxID=1908690 RepID=A0A225DDW0_9BACT|nr:hypothetical protein [Fimbriiglobus ruber]OWK34307.1 hypothetical protein FRUB_10278 [Fimbriiglobus ruber]